jgi:pimeloyl-ACP methyl ester carboxylesterase
VSTVCYSKYLGFDKDTDPALADPALQNNPCEQTSKDSLASRIYGLLAYLDSLKIVGSRVDLVAHSMGGLAARNYASQPWYDKSLRSRKQGQLHEIITLDTPELGSKLASSLIDHKNCLGRDNDFTTVWGAFCGSGILPLPVHLTVAQCLAKLGFPLAVDLERVAF